MIEEFSFGNYSSFKEVQTLKMTAGKIKSHNSTLDINNIFQVQNNLNLLKSKAIYGANASGKSNVIKALVTFIRIIKESAKDETSLILIDPFLLSTKTIKQPTFFQLIFWMDGKRFRYGFEASDKAINSEWLFSTPDKREQTLFIREHGKINDINQTHFHEGVLYRKLFKDSEEQIFTEKSLFLSHLSSTGIGKESKNIFKYISAISVISGLGSIGMYGLAGDSLKVPIKKKFILDFLKNADLGIENLETEVIIPEDSAKIEENRQSDGEERKIIVSSRFIFNDKNKKVGTANFSFGLQESEGTKKMFELSPFIYDSLKDGTALIIDEFDARFHPLLTKKIIELYNSHQNKNAQLIFTTHDTNLLSSDLLRRDQIDFVEKDKFGGSHLYTLIEIKGVRNDASFEKDYIQGKYGAIPFLGNFNNLFI